jgi:hypothetical protein
MPETRLSCLLWSAHAPFENLLDPWTFHDRIAAHPDRVQQTQLRGVMTNGGKYISPYDLRVQLVQKALRDHSTLDEKTSLDLAVHVLDALDHIPERSR